MFHIRIYFGILSDSVGLFDSDKGDKLIGASVAKTMNSAPDNFEAEVSQRSRMIESILELENEMMKKIKGKYLTAISDSEVVMDVWGVALHQDYMGKRLLYQMIIAN